MGLLAYVRAALIANEIEDGRSGQLSVDRRGVLWVQLADALSVTLGAGSALIGLVGIKLGSTTIAAGQQARASSIPVVLSTEDAALLPASLGAKAPSASLSVTGSLAAASPTTVVDASGTGSAVQLGSLAAGPSGICVQNTSAIGAPNIRVGDSSITTTRGRQIAPGAAETFVVDNASRLYVIAESGSPTYGVSQA